MAGSGANFSSGFRPGQKAPQVNDSLCHTCRHCMAMAACRWPAFIRFDRNEAPYVDASQCRGCLVCMPACPFGAVQL